MKIVGIKYFKVIKLYIMKVIDTIKVYVQHPKLIGYSIKESYFNCRDKFYNWLKRIVYKYEANLKKFRFALFFCN